MVSTAVVEGGEPVRLTGAGFLPGVLVTVEVSGEPAQAVRADERGTARVQVRPSRPGTQLLSMNGRAPEGGLRVVSATVRVFRSDDRAFADGYSHGRDVLPGLLRGLAVVVALAMGTLAVRLARRPALPA